MENLEILVIGAGIGGLSAGIALKQAGYTVRVFDQVKEMRPVGAAISLSSPGRARSIDRAVPGTDGFMPRETLDGRKFAWHGKYSHVTIMFRNRLKPNSLRGHHGQSICSENVSCHFGFRGIDARRMWRRQ